MWTLILASLLAAAPEVEVRTLNGESIVGSLTSLGADEVVVEASQGSRALPAKQLLSISRRSKTPAEPKTPQVWLELIDGSRLTGSQYTTAAGQAVLTLLDDQELKLSTRSIASVRLKDQSQRIADQWAEILAAKKSGDAIVIRREEAIDFLEGVLGDVTEETVQFQLDGDTVDVKRPKVEGFVYFNRATAELPAPLCVLTDAGGNSLQVKELALDGDQLQATTLGGLKLQRPLEALVEIDYSLGKVKYLSDLEPELAEHWPLIPLSASDRHFDPRTDRAFFDGPLRVGSQTYAKGLALKSRTRLVYRLPARFSRFEAIVGIDAGVAPLGHVRLTVRGDGNDQPLFEADIAGSDPPQPISLAIEGVKRLTIEVDFGEGGDVADYLDLCEARVIQ